MDLEKKTYETLLKVKGARLIPEDLALLDDYLAGVVSEETSIAKNICVSTPSAVSKIISLLENMPPSDVQMIEQQIYYEISRKFLNAHLDQAETRNFRKNSPAHSRDFLVSILKSLTLRHKHSGRGNHNNRDTLVRKHLFIEVYAFFIEEKGIPSDEMTSTNWFNQFMDTLTQDLNVKNKLCPYNSNIGEYILAAKKFYPIRNRIRSTPASACGH